MGLGEQCRDDVPARVEIGCHDHELPESRLTEVLTQHLRVAPAECGRRRPGDRGGAPDRFPDGVSESLTRSMSVERCCNDAPPPATLGSTGSDGSAHQNATGCQRGQDRQQGYGREARD